jgi:hypothetical protein
MSQRALESRTLTFMPYCSFAIIGLSEMNVNSLRRHVNGRGTMSARKMTISAINIAKTCRRSNSKHVGNILGLELMHEGLAPMRRKDLHKRLHLASIRIGRKDLQGCSRASCLLARCGLFTSGVCWYKWQWALGTKGLPGGLRGESKCHGVDGD